MEGRTKWARRDFRGSGTLRLSLVLGSPDGASLSLFLFLSLSLSFRFSRWCVSLPTGDFEHNSIIKVKKRWFVLFTVVILLTQSIAFHHPRQSVRAVGVALRERLTSVS